MSQNTENQQNNSENNNKVVKQFITNMTKFAALMGGPKNIKVVSKVKKDAVSEMVSDLFKEENEAILVKTKEDIKNLIKAKVSFDRELQAKEKELETLKITKMKEFNTKAVAVFNQIEGIDDMTTEYSRALKEAASAGESKEEGDETK